MDDRRAYQSYEGFLQAAIKAYWERGTGQKLRFLALLLASREAWQVAWDGVASKETGKKILAGAAGAAALGLLLRVVVGGPIGILLTAASIASLVALYVRNPGSIWRRAERYRAIIDEFRPLHARILSDDRAGKLGEGQRELMIDGLMGRFLEALDADSDEATDSEEPETFADHAARKREEEEERKAADAEAAARRRDRDGEGR